MQYFISPIFQMKLALTGLGYEHSSRAKRIMDGIIALLALIYSAWIIKSGTENLIVFGLSLGLFLLGFILYPLMKRGGDK
ncbi:ABC transporter [Listeria fleischmannii FSL S10-1203]|uniref:ABC transporter n=1 Tax=Listeria fleischmannii FSL S10-1203 TaxID=1265822 RepID=W7DQV6_9LIST|nr:ABC transporter [Listeria fleischmannii FSL S10-1203]